MNCPKCKASTTVRYTRDVGDRRIRSRACKTCNRTFRTEEVHVVENHAPKYLPFRDTQNLQASVG